MNGMDTETGEKKIPVDEMSLGYQNIAFVNHYIVVKYFAIVDQMGDYQ